VNPIVPTNLAITTSPIVGGNPDNATVTLSANAPNGGILVTLLSGNAAATVPGSITVVAGHNTGGFTITTNPVATDTVVNIQAKAGGTAKTTPFTIQAARLSKITFGASSVNGGRSVSVTFTLTGKAPTGGRVVSLSSSPTGILLNPTSTAVAANTTSVTITLNTNKVSSPTNVTLTGTFLSTPKSASIFVMPPGHIQP